MDRDDIGILKELVEGDVLRSKFFCKDSTPNRQFSSV